MRASRRLTGGTLVNRAAATSMPQLATRRERCEDRAVHRN